jgi:hypothetical protein
LNAKYLKYHFHRSLEKGRSGKHIPLEENHEKEVFIKRKQEANLREISRDDHKSDNFFSLAIWLLN